MAIMFSSPAMIGMFISGVFILFTFVGAIALAVIQVSRGTFKIDYDRMAADAMKEHQLQRNKLK